MSAKEDDPMLDISQRALEAKVKTINQYLNLLLRDRHKVDLTDILRILSVEMRSKVDIVKDHEYWSLERLRDGDVEFIRLRKAG